MKEWTTRPEFSSPLVDHLPKAAGIPSPKDVLGHHIGEPKKLTYYADILKYYRALASATPRVKVLSIGKSDENRELVVVFVGSDESLKNLETYRRYLGQLADPRTMSDAQAKDIIAKAKPIYHLMGGLHSGEVGPSEMLMELVYRIATEDSSLVKQIRDNVIVSVTPVADPDGRDRNVDWFNLYGPQQTTGNPQIGVPYWGKYVFHDDNRDINYSQVSMRALLDWYLQWHPPIMHDLHQAQTLLYTFSGQAPQNPTLDPILYGELPMMSNFEMAQMTKYGMPGVWTHGFVDMWSPGYLAFMSSNHNGMIRMYEIQGFNGANTQRMRLGPSTPGAARGRSGQAAPSTSDAAGGRPGQAPEGGGGGRGGAAAEGGRGQAPTNAAQAQEAGPTGDTAAALNAGRGGQGREWYRPLPATGEFDWSLRNNTNYGETGVLTALQYTSTFPKIILENFYQKSRNSIDAARKDAVAGYVIAPNRDMTRVERLVNMLRMQGIEVGKATAEVKLREGTFPAGSFIVKRDQPYGRLAKILLEK
ncbi:MAG TPA: M14 family zinc carboxypeptidase, partial [Vicinamibacterales bacterium]|nr:M14 family zinc carboxypeptidase [Vicinamibacterales bacterium]